MSLTDWTDCENLIFNRRLCQSFSVFVRKYFNNSTKYFCFSNFADDTSQKKWRSQFWLFINNKWEIFGLLFFYDFSILLP